MIFESVTVAIGATDETQSLINTVDGIFSTCNPQDIEKIMIVTPRMVSTECLKAINFLTDKYPHKTERLIQKKAGIGGAMQDAIAHTESSHIMFLAADSAMDIDCIKKMTDEAKLNPQSIIKASRWLQKNSFKNYNKLKKILNKTAQIFLRVLYNTDITDFTGAILTAPTQTYKSINFTSTDFSCLLEATLLPVKMGCDFKEVPAMCYGRTQGNSKNSFKQTAAYLKTAIRLRFSK